MKKLKKSKSRKKKGGNTVVVGSCANGSQVIMNTTWATAEAAQKFCAAAKSFLVEYGEVEKD